MPLWALSGPVLSEEVLPLCLLQLILDSTSVSLFMIVTLLMPHRVGLSNAQFQFSPLLPTMRTQKYMYMYCKYTPTDFV